MPRQQRDAQPIVFQPASPAPGFRFSQAISLR